MKTKLRFGLLLLLGLVTAAFIVWQQQRVQRSLSEVATLRDQREITTSLREENQRLAEQLKAATERSETALRELARVRAQAEAMRQTNVENTRVQATRDQAAQQTPPTQRE